MSILDRLEELERKVDQMVVRGVIHSVDHASQRVVVKFDGDQLTAPLEWKPTRSGRVTTWSPPEVGEGVTILSPGDVNLGEVLPGSYHSSMPPPSTSPDEVAMLMPDGTLILYNHAEHKLSVKVEGDVDLVVTGDVKAKVGGDIIADGDNIKLNGGAGVVTGAHICQISGKPHSDCSSTVTAGK